MGIPLLLLLDGDQYKFLEAEWVERHVPVEGFVTYHPHNNSVWDPALKQVGHFKTGLISLHTEGSDFTFHIGVSCHFPFIVSCLTQILVDSFI